MIPYQSVCEIKWCQKRTFKIVRAVENIGDGAWNVVICPDCADALGVREGGDLPEAHIVEKIIKRRKRAMSKKKNKPPIKQEVGCRSNIHIDRSKNKDERPVKKKVSKRKRRQGQ